MPTIHKRQVVLFAEEEFNELLKQAKANKLSPSNYVRSWRGLPPLTRTGAPGGRAGGPARAKKLSAKRRSDIARTGALAKHAKGKK